MFGPEKLHGFDFTEELDGRKLTVTWSNLGAAGVIVSSLCCTRSTWPVFSTSHATKQTCHCVCCSRLQTDKYVLYLRAKFRYNGVGVPTGEKVTTVTDDNGDVVVTTTPVLSTAARPVVPQAGSIFTLSSEAFVSDTNGVEYPQKATNDYLIPFDAACSPF